jgi:hypothetical protein
VVFLVFLAFLAFEIDVCLICLLNSWTAPVRVRKKLSQLCLNRRHQEVALERRDAFRRRCGDDVETDYTAAGRDPVDCYLGFKR